MKRINAFLRGLFECRSDFGITYYDDPNHPLSVAYDRGRSFGEWLLSE